MLLIAGLVLSIPLVVLGSTVVMKIMGRYPMLVYVGAALIAWTAGEMIDTDATAQAFLPSQFHDYPLLETLLVLGVVGYGWIHNRVITPSH